MLILNKITQAVVTDERSQESGINWNTQLPIPGSVMYSVCRN